LLPLLGLVFLLHCSGDESEPKEEPKTFAFFDHLATLFAPRLTDPIEAEDYQYRYELASTKGYAKDECLTKGSALIQHFQQFEPVHLNIYCAAQGFIFVKWYVKGDLITEEPADLVGVTFSRDLSLTLTETIPILAPQCPAALANDFVSFFQVEGTIFAPFGNTQQFKGSLEFSHGAEFSAIFHDLTINGQFLEGEVEATAVTVDGTTIEALFDLLLPGEQFGKSEPVPTILHTTSILSKDYRSLDGDGWFEIPSMRYLKITTTYDGSMTECTDQGLPTPPASYRP